MGFVHVFLRLFIGDAADALRETQKTNYGQYGEFGKSCAPRAQKVRLRHITQSMRLGGFPGSCVKRQIGGQSVSEVRLVHIMCV